MKNVKNEDKSRDRSIAAFILVLLCLMIVAIFGTVANSQHDQSSVTAVVALDQIGHQEHRQLVGLPPNDPEVILKKDLKALKGLQPLKEANSIMFWRLQKVGSSTILSILMSYGYRYNLIPKRKSNSNAFCRVLGSAMLAANTALDETQKSNFSMTDYVPATTLQRQDILSEFARANAKDFTDEQVELLNKYVNFRMPGMQSQKSASFPRGTRFAEAERQSVAIPYKIVLSHELCNFNADLIEKYLPLAFPIVPVATEQKKAPSPEGYPQVDELFMVRDPLSRAVSVYYFWGELFKLVKHRRSQSISDSLQSTLPKVNETEKALFLAKYHNNPAFKPKIKHEVAPENDRRKLGLRRTGGKNRGLNRQTLTLGGAPSQGVVRGSMFTYHGNESTVPPVEIAVEYARTFPYKAGMPGPTLSWSAFANNIDDAIKRVKSDKLMTIVLERLDESLVVMRHHLGWSLADVVVTKQRKALSSHPKVAEWPKAAVEILASKFKDHHEYQLYNAADEKLDDRIQVLKKKGIDVKEEVQLLKNLRQRVSEVSCLVTADMNLHSCLFL
jgi:hypothetical protein